LDGNPTDADHSSSDLDGSETVAVALAMLSTCAYSRSVASEHAFEEGEAVTGPSGPSGLSPADIRALAARRTSDALARLLDDLNLWIEAHAEVTAADHLGHVTKRLEMARKHEAQIAASRAAAGPEQVRRARRWARSALDRARRFQEQFPRRASAFDFAYALSAAVRQAEEYQRTGTPVPAAADLVAAVADPVITRPEPAPIPGAIDIITIPSAGEEPAAHDETSGDPDADAELSPTEPRPLPPADRQIAAERIVALIIGTIDQIDRVLGLAVVLHGIPGPDRFPEQSLAGAARRDPQIALAVVVEIQRLRAAEYTRRHEDAMRVLKTVSRTSEGD
jgi:hypothetical protein